jgi:hypothetical protein
MTFIGKCPICSTELIDAAPDASCPSGHYRIRADLFDRIWLMNMEPKRQLLTLLRANQIDHESKNLPEQWLENKLKELRPEPQS